MKARNRGYGFSLVELLVVVGIIATLIAILLPALSKSRSQALSVACMANLKQNHAILVMYSMENRGWMFPSGLGGGLPKEQRWPMKVYKPARYDPPTLTCPADKEPAAEHSYVLNSYLQTREIRYEITKGVSATEIILMGEKRSNQEDYYMDAAEGDFQRVVEIYRHGLFVGSNYLFLDGHVESRILPRSAAQRTLDPWEPEVAPVVPQPPPV